MTIKTTGQFGEYAAASELCRRGLIATTFTRNMPGFDILVLNPNSKKSYRVQVKTIVSGEWSLDVKRYLNFDEEEFEKGIQKIIGKKVIDETDYFVFVKMNSVKRTDDKFYILHVNQLQDIIYKNYNSFLKSINGKRPRNPKTTHTAIKEEDIKEFEDKWEVFGGD